MGKWSDIPLDLLLLLEEHVVLYGDKLRMRAVCLYWNLQLPKMPNRRFPWLLQAIDNNTEASHALFNPIDKKFFFLDCPGLLQGKIFKGSAFGWVVTLEDVYDKKNSNRIYLVNPLTSARIELPSRDKFPDIMRYQPYRVNKEYSIFQLSNKDPKYFFYQSYKEITDDFTKKFVMSCDPSRSDGEECIVVALYGQESLACCTLKDKRWNPIPSLQAGFADILFSKGKLYGLIYHGPTSQVLAIENINGIDSKPKITLFANHRCSLKNITTLNPGYDHTILVEYLVESSDGSCLMIVERYLRFNRIRVKRKKEILIPETCNFIVYRVDPITRTSIELKCIGDDVLILGINASVPISSDNSLGYKSNHIYFMDSAFSYERSYIRLENNDIGVFSLEDGTIQPLCGFKSKPEFLWPPPIWV